MAKKSNPPPEVEDADDQKKRKKQAKKEAKMMLEIEEAKVSIQKAEKKLAKDQARLEARNTHLHTLEAELTEFRASHEESQIDAQPNESEQETAQLVPADKEATIVPEAGLDHQNGQPELEEVSRSNQS